ncbi:prolyl oligopeptidase family serine peptidase [Massilia sp. W12]|uniref:prolyl oligopeptidase family serine peptidase n=1 Tax=Massilia sp. W12 TaxID=3126507 RepID=UPI0030D346C7
MKAELTAGLLAALLPLSALAQNAACLHSAHSFQYPASKKVEQVDLMHGVRVADPYRWLEENNSPQVAQWVGAQNSFARSWIDQYPQRSAIHTRLSALWNFSRYTVPEQQGGLYLFAHNNGLQNQAPLYVQKNWQDAPRMILDPNTLSADGTLALEHAKLSPDGRYLAYAVAGAGSDWNEVRVRDVASGKDTKDLLQWVKFSEPAWAADGSGFYYSRYDEPKGGGKYADANYYQKLYFHKLGTAQSEDRLVFESRENKTWMFEAKPTEDGRYLLIDVGMGGERKNRFYLQDLKDEKSKLVKLLDKSDGEYHFIGSRGAELYFRTNKDAPRSRVVRMRADTPEQQEVLVAEREYNLTEAEMMGGQLILSYLKDAHSQVLQMDLDGKLVREVKLPGIGTAKDFKGGSSAEAFYSFANFSNPGVIYRYDLASGESRPVLSPKLQFDPAQYVTRQVFFKSRDGVRVPMFISHRKDLVLNGDNPTILYGYGGFNIAMTPAFSPANLAWMERGGVYVLVNLRGGGEYGKSWHEAGTLLQKQNTFNDFIAAGEWLIDNKYTKPARLASYGGSNGGLLVAATMLQRPDLFGAAMPAVGVHDMLRFHKFTIGWTWVSDYGSAENAQQFKALYAYSPLHNVKPDTCYPPTLILTGDHDDRVVPAHSYKLAAALQAAQGGSAPILLRVDMRAGHGKGKPTTKQIDEATDRLSFLSRVMGLSWSAPAQSKATGQ